MIIQEAIESYRTHIDRNCLEAPQCLIDAETALKVGNTLQAELVEALGELADAVADGSELQRLTAAMARAGAVLAKAETLKDSEV